MSDKYAKEIAQSLKGIHQELRKLNQDKQEATVKKTETLKELQPKDFI